MQSLLTLKESFDQDGYLFLASFLTDDQIHELDSRLETFIRDVVPSLPPQLAFYENKEDRNSLKQVFNMAAHSPYFKALSNGSKFEKLAEVLLGEKIAKREVEYFNKPAGVGQPTPPHQDSYYFMLTPPQAVTFWIPLEEVDEENGCLRYIRGSHLKGMRPHGRTATLGFSQGITDFGTDEDKQYEEIMPAKTGDVLVHHGMTIHRADGNSSQTRSRRVVGIVYFGESAKEDIEAKRAYQQKLNDENLQNSR